MATSSKNKQTELPCLTGRDAAVNCLMKFSQNQQRIQSGLDDIFNQVALDDRERRLATELAYGTCRHILGLDYLIGKFSNRAFGNINPMIIQILRVGLYQMLYMNRTPDFASVHQAVQQSRKLRLKGVPGFINAILRAVQREIKDFVNTTEAQPANQRAVLELGENRACIFNSNILPDPERHWVKYCSVSFSQPPWLIKRWLTQYDKQAVYDICQAHNSRPNMVLRINSLRCKPEKLLTLFEQAGLQTCLPDTNNPDTNMVAVFAGGRCEYLPGYDEGLFSVQDSSAAMVAGLLAPEPGQRILDLCAAPGGKTTHLSELMQNKGTIIASDVSPDKLNLIQENCQRLGINIVQTTPAEDIPAIVQQQGRFDAVLVDAPCSNTGVLARRVEARYRLKPSDITQLRHIQLELLEKARQFVKPGGTIVYSTCSIDKTENSHLMQSFVKAHQEIALDTQQLIMPGFKPGVTTPPGHLPANAAVRTHRATNSIYHDGGFAVKLICR